VKKASALRRKKALRALTPLRRTRSLEPGPGPKRKTELRKVNPERRARLRARNFGDHASFVRSLSCVVNLAPVELRTPCYGELEAAHLRTRGMGGCGGDWRQLFPACRGHHEEQEGRTPRFEERYQLDLGLLVNAYIVADPGAAKQEQAAALERALLIAPTAVLPHVQAGNVVERWARLQREVGR
jgi:hypothetical protein